MAVSLNCVQINAVTSNYCKRNISLNHNYLQRSTCKETIYWEKRQRIFVIFAIFWNIAVSLSCVQTYAVTSNYHKRNISFNHNYLHRLMHKETIYWEKGQFAYAVSLNCVQINAVTSNYHKRNINFNHNYLHRLTCKETIYWEKEKFT